MERTMSATNIEKVRASFDLATTLLGISLSELRTFSLLKSSHLTIDDLENSLQVIEQIINCDKVLREYLNAVGGRRESADVKELIEALSNLLEKLSEVTLPENSPIPYRIEKINIDLKIYLDSACPNGTC